MGLQQAPSDVGVCHVLAIVVGGSPNGLPFLLGWLVSAYNFLCCFLARSRRTSQEGNKGIVEGAEQAMVKALVVGSLCAVQLHCTAVIVAEVAIVNCGVVCIHCALQGRLLLVCWFLRAVGPRVLCRFIREGMERAWYLAIAPGLFIAWFFRLIVLQQSSLLLQVLERSMRGCFAAWCLLS